jgi:hypothetical protein
MDKILATIKASRKKLLSLVADLSTDEMNYIPTGFNNNLAWQIGHMVVSQQILCYKLAGQPYLIEAALFDGYRNGSKPEKYISAEEIEQMKGYLLSTIDQLEIDFNNGIFSNFSPYKISTYADYELNNIVDAVTFIVSHDGLHYGCSLGLKRLAKMATIS